MLSLGISFLSTWLFVAQNISKIYTAFAKILFSPHKSQNSPLFTL